MLSQIVMIVTGLVGGIAVGIQSPLAGAMSQQVGGAASSFIIHLSGTIFSLLFLVARGGENIDRWRSLPTYMFGAGALGLVLYMTVSYTVPRLGATGAMLLIVVGQLSFGLMADQFGWFGLAQRPVDLSRVLAVLLMLAGAYLVAR